MQNGIAKTMLLNDNSDFVCTTFESPLTHLRWGARVPITDITELQLRVYTIEEKALIDACEAEFPEIPHFPLNKIFYGLPWYDGLFPCCRSPLSILKDHVDKRVIGPNQGIAVDPDSLLEVKQHLNNLTKQKMVQNREKNVVEQWVPPRVIEERSHSRILSDTALSVKLYDSPPEYKDWIAVSKPLNFPWKLLFFRHVLFCHGNLPSLHLHGMHAN